MKLIVGLGNEGREYEGTRHNIGFAVVERLAPGHSVSGRWDPIEAGPLRFRVREIMIGTTRVRLIRPGTMMNRSGEVFTHPTMKEVIPNDLLIVCDDVNLPLGTLRLRPGGSDGGHHGLASCLEALKTQDVPRLRLGVGCERLPNELTEFVLSPFTADERHLADLTVTRAIEACEMWAAEGIQVAMNRVNQLKEDPRGESGV